MRFWFNLNLYEEFEFLDVLDFRGVAFSMESVISDIIAPMIRVSCVGVCIQVWGLGFRV